MDRKRSVWCVELTGPACRLCHVHTRLFADNALFVQSRWRWLKKDFRCAASSAEQRSLESSRITGTRTGISCSQRMSSFTPTTSASFRSLSQATISTTTYLPQDQTIRSLLASRPCPLRALALGNPLLHGTFLSLAYRTSRMLTCSTSLRFLAQRVEALDLVDLEDLDLRLHSVAVGPSLPKLLHRLSR